MDFLTGCRVRKLHSSGEKSRETKGARPCCAKLRVFQTRRDETRAFETKPKGCEANVSSAWFARETDANDTSGAEGDVSTSGIECGKVRQESWPSSDKREPPKTIGEADGGRGGGKVRLANGPPWSAFSSVRSDVYCATYLTTCPPSSPHTTIRDVARARERDSSRNPPRFES